jgi:hypothetical protein
MTHRWVIPLFHGTPQAVETSHAMWDVPRGWAVPVWLGWTSLAGVSQFGWGVPAVGHPTLKRAVPRQVGRPSALWDVPRGWAVPVWLGWTSLAGVSQFGWGVPAVGHPTLKRAVPRQVGRSSAAWDVLWVGCPSLGRLSRVLLGSCPSKLELLTLRATHCSPSLEMGGRCEKREPVGAV